MSSGELGEEEVESGAETAAFTTTAAAMAAFTLSEAGEGESTSSNAMERKKEKALSLSLFLAFELASLVSKMLREQVARATFSPVRISSLGQRKVVPETRIDCFYYYLITGREKSSMQAIYHARKQVILV